MTAIAARLLADAERAHAALTFKIRERLGLLGHPGDDLGRCPSAVPRQQAHRRPHLRFYYRVCTDMVVLYAGGASYWVVNTIDDSLSNETMIAIAKDCSFGSLHK